VVLSVNGKSVTSSSEMTREVAKTLAGNTMSLSILREGKPKTIEVKAGIRPSEAQLNGKAPSGDNETAPDAPKSKRPAVLGLSLGTLDDAARSRFKVPETVRGVLVEGVNQTSDAGLKGLKTGDVLVRVADKAVSTPQDVVAAVDGAKASGRESVLLLVYRDGRTLFVLVKMAK